MGKFGKKSLKRFFLNLSIIRLQFTNFEKHFDNKSCQPISGNDTTQNARKLHKNIFVKKIGVSNDCKHQFLFLNLLKNSAV